MPKLLVQDPIPKLNYLGFCDTLCHNDQPKHSCIGFLKAFMGLPLEILQTSQLLNPNPLVIPPQLMENSIIGLNVGNRPCILVDVHAPPL
jgi:hypothetical protein